MVNKYLQYLEYEKCYSNSTIQIYGKYLKIFEKNGFDIELTMRCFKTNSSATRRVCLSAIKGYLKFNCDKRWSYISLPRKENNVQYFLKDDEYYQIINLLTKKNKNSILKKIVVRLLYETGIRSSELLNIKINDVDGNKILINGKGKKQRNIWISDSLKYEIQHYIEVFNIKTRLFNFMYKNLYKKVRGIGKLINKNLTPHMFRRGFATYCIKKDIDIFSLSKMMGHSDLNTTKAYIYDFDLQAKMQNLFQ